jgi:hypothetical protein
MPALGTIAAGTTRPDEPTVVRFGVARHLQSLFMSKAARCRFCAEGCHFRPGGIPPCVVHPGWPSSMASNAPFMARHLVSEVTDSFGQIAQGVCCWFGFAGEVLLDRRLYFLQFAFNASGLGCFVAHRAPVEPVSHPDLVAMHVIMTTSLKVAAKLLHLMTCALRATHRHCWGLGRPSHQFICPA